MMNFFFWILLFLILSFSIDAKNKQINHGIVMQALMPQHDQISEFFTEGNVNFECI